jgi:hypothetical protein
MRRANGFAGYLPHGSNLALQIPRVRDLLRRKPRFSNCDSAALASFSSGLAPTNSKFWQYPENHGVAFSI